MAGNKDGRLIVATVITFFVVLGAAMLGAWVKASDTGEPFAPNWVLSFGAAFLCAVVTFFWPELGGKKGGQNRRGGRR